MTHWIEFNLKWDWFWIQESGGSCCRKLRNRTLSKLLQARELDGHSVVISRYCRSNFTEEFRKMQASRPVVRIAFSFSTSFRALNLIKDWVCRSGNIGELMGCVLLLWNTCALMCRHPRGKLKLMFCWRAAQMARWGITCAYVCVFCLLLCLLAFCNVI